MDTGISSTMYDDIYSISSDEMIWKNRITKLAAEYPDQVIIKYRPEDNDGCIVAKIPKSWVKIVPPRKMSEEQKQKRTEVLKHYMLSKNSR